MYACEEQSKTGVGNFRPGRGEDGVLRRFYANPLFLQRRHQAPNPKSSFFISAALAASSAITISDLPPPPPKSMSAAAAAAPEPPSSDPSAHPPDPSPIGTKTLESHGSDEKPGSDRVETDAGGGGGGGEAAEAEAEEEEEEGECGFCLFMKAGGCRDAFVDWEKCIEEAEKSKEDIVDKCYQATAALKKCMEAHPDYYEPILRAEKAAEEEAVKELEREAAAKDAERSSRSSAEPAPGERTETLEVANE
ncbi:hypothetical protein NL676_032316 [Syzygium grande]|nr:hypothetical protein NL676_032316 [Syzygium grande]